MFAPELLAQAECLLAAARDRKFMIATAESCTGGLIAGLFTEISGSSDVFERGFVTYSNQAKQELLGVPQDLLGQFGAVSAPVARAMAEGALARSNADLAVAVTGIAGPSGGSAQKPVGLVYVAVLRKSAEAKVVEHRFGDIGRSAVRLGTVAAAITLLQECI